MTPSVAPPFRWRDTPWGAVLVDDELSGHVAHAFTTRAFDVALAAGATSAAALARLFGVEADRVVRARQVHGATVFRIDKAAPLVTGIEADALLTTDPTRVVAVSVADCVPVLIADRGRHAVAAVHAGWRGTAAEIVGATVEAFARAGTGPETLVAAIGPSIGPCCYQVDRRVRDAFVGRQTHAGDWFIPDGDARWKLDLWEANRRALVDRGVPAASIHVARVCTCHHAGRFHSFRRDGAAAGRMFAAISPGSHPRAPASAP